MTMAASRRSLVIVEDFEPYLKEAVSNSMWEYFRMGVGREQTLRDNILAYQRYRLRPRCLRDVSNRDTSTSILGQHLDYPILVSPTAFHGAICPEGEVETAKGVASSSTGMVLSMWSNRSLEDVAASVARQGTPLFQQLNFIRDNTSKARKVDYIESLVGRAERAGYKGIFVTVDHPFTARVNHRLGVGGPDTLKLTFPQAMLPGDKPLDVNRFSVDPSLTWDDITWLQSITSLPIILKGILTADDAKQAVKHGVAGILVSNHGGRQFDGVPASIDALREVVGAVQGSNIEVYVDGGIRKGTDVLKALALGARAVFIGRPVLWGLAYDGADGVKKILQIIREEFNLAMALAGCSSLADITPDLISAPAYSKL